MSCEFPKLFDKLYKVVLNPRSVCGLDFVGFFPKICSYEAGPAIPIGVKFSAIFISGTFVKKIFFPDKLCLLLIVLTVSIASLLIFWDNSLISDCRALIFSTKLSICFLLCVLVLYTFV